MILDEESTLLPKAQAAARESASAAQSSSEGLIASELPPPPYYQSVQGRPPDPPLDVLHDEENCRHARAGERFLRAAAVAFVIWSLFTTAIQVGVWLARRSHKRLGVEDAIGKLGYSKETDGRIRHCIRLSDLTSSSSPNASASSLAFLDASFSLPLSSQNLTLFSRGVFAPSLLELVPSDDDGDSIRADVRVVTHPQNPAHASTHVCELVSASGEDHTLAIYGPGAAAAPAPADLLSVFLTLHVPSRAHDFVRLRRLTTDLPAFEHALGDLGGAVHFGALSLRTADGAIDVQSVTADNITLETGGGAVSGAFDVHNTLSVRSERGSIAGTFDLHARGVASEPARQLSLVTAHGNISATLALRSASRRPGAYHLTLRTETGDAALHLAAAPLRAQTRVNATARGGRVAVALPPLYEGAFLLRAAARPPVRASRGGREARGCEEDAARREVRCVDSIGDEFGRDAGLGWDADGPALVPWPWDGGRGAVPNRSVGTSAARAIGFRRTQETCAREADDAFWNKGILYWDVPDERTGLEVLESGSVVWVTGEEVRLVV